MSTTSAKGTTTAGQERQVTSSTPHPAMPDTQGKKAPTEQASSRRSEGSRRRPNTRSYSKLQKAMRGSKHGSQAASDAASSVATKLSKARSKEAKSMHSHHSSQHLDLALQMEQMLADRDRLSTWSANGLRYADTEDLYSMPEAAAAPICVVA